MKPDRNKFTPAELKIIDKYRTPRQVQQYLRTLAYNRASTIYSFREVVRHKTAHCLEGALAAAAILEQHGYPPLLMSLESVDNLDHVLLFLRQTQVGGLSGVRVIQGCMEGVQSLEARAISRSAILTPM